MKVVYLLEETNEYHPRNKSFTERVKRVIEVALATIRPKKTLLIGFKGRIPYYTYNEVGFSLLNELKYEHLFEAKAEGDRYVVSKLR